MKTQVKCGFCWLAGAGLLLSGNLAMAHAHPRQLSPAADASVAAPAEVSIAFNEGLEGAFSSLTVVNAAGEAVTNTKAEVDANNSKLIRLRVPTLAPGSYTVHWVAVGTDGHRVQGEYRFSVK